MKERKKERTMGGGRSSLNRQSCCRTLSGQRKHHTQEGETDRQRDREIDRSRERERDTPGHHQLSGTDALLSVSFSYRTIVLCSRAEAATRIVVVRAAPAIVTTIVTTSTAAAAAVTNVVVDKQAEYFEPTGFSSNLPLEQDGENTEAVC